jgi:hypothetical protein
MVEPLFPKALRGIHTDEGDSYDLLPSEIKAMHNAENILVAQGSADIKRDTSFLAKASARLFGFPKEGRNVPVTVTFMRTEDGETLQRDFGGEIFTTIFYDCPKAGHLIERFGPLWFLLECICTRQGIDMYIRKIWLLKIIPLPMCIAPRIDATERVDNGQYRFDVDIRLPMIGRIIHYKGWLSIVR